VGSDGVDIALRNGSYLKVVGAHGLKIENEEKVFSAVSERPDTFGQRSHTRECGTRKMDHRSTT
jgi:hypothetical protein